MNSAAGSSKMTYAKLQYARNLEQEEHALRKQAQAEYKKRIQNKTESAT